ncbi:MAG: hypothetical protein ACRD18_09965 [Terriglobia bacterium]
MSATLPEKIEILIILTEDPDQEIRNQAIQTLKSWNSVDVCRTLADAETPPFVLEFAAYCLVDGRPDLLDVLLQNPALNTEVQDLILARIAATDRVENSAAQVAVRTGATPSSREEPAKPDPLNAGGETILQKLGRMTAAQKIKCALMGSQEERLILVRDANKMVARAALQSPKLTEAEIEAYASMKNVAGEILRLIAGNHSFLKSYSVLRALVNNPRAPLDTTLSVVNRLNDRDMKSLSVNKNIPDALRTAAAKTLSSRQTARTPSFSRKH